MNKILLAAAITMLFGGAAQANEKPAQSGPSSLQQQKQSTVASSNAVAGASNAGNSQNITFTSPPTTTSNITYGGSQTVNQNVTGSNSQTIKYDGPQTINQNVSGTTTQNQNQTVNATTNQTINGKTEQVVSGGTNSTIHQEFGTQTIKNTPSVSGPPLVSSNDTCMGSASGSVNAPGFGLSVGKTYTDANCVLLKNSRELWNMGMKAASMALMCMDANNRAALEMTGFVCPQSGRQAVIVREREAALKAGEPIDPIVRERMGLPKIRE